MKKLMNVQMMLPCSAVALMTLIGLSVAEARPGVRKLDNRGKGNKSLSHTIGDARALGATKDKFVAHKRATAGGSGFYSDTNAKIRGTHVSIYGTITNSLLEDRLSDTEGRSFIDRLLAIGSEAGGKDLSEAEAEVFRTRLKKLSDDVREARADNVNQAATTPRINRLQMTQEEVIRFGIDSGELSAAQVSSLRRKMDSVEAKEQSAKSDGEVDDRERENALEASRGVWEDIVKVLRP